MIIETTNDLFQTSKRTILCTCNAAGAMGKGVALEVKNRSYRVFDVYRSHWPRCNDPRLLDRSLARQLKMAYGPKKNVLLFCTKYHWRENSPIELIDHNLGLLARDWDTLKIESLAMPPLGCGNGNLNWERDVRSLVYQHLSQFDVEVCGLAQVPTLRP